MSGPRAGPLRVDHPQTERGLSNNSRDTGARATTGRPTHPETVSVVKTSIILAPKGMVRKR